MEGDPNVGSSSSSAIKKRKKASKVWDEMSKYPDADGNVIAQCKHCKKTFDGSSTKGTTHLKNHLQRCPANPKRKSGSDGRDGDDQHQSLSPSIKTKELARLIKENSVFGLIKHFSSTEGDTSDEDLDPLSVLNSRKDEILQLYQEEKEKFCQFLNNLSCRFTLRLVCRIGGMDCVCLLEVNYIDDSWERQSKIISFWHCPRENLTEAVKQSCMDWKIDTNICFLFLSLSFNTADGLDSEIGKMESLFSQRRSLPFAGCLLDTDYLRDHYVDSVLKPEDYVGDGIRSLKECAADVQNKSTSDKLIQLDRLVEEAIYKVNLDPLAFGVFDYIGAAMGLREVFSALEQFDSEFRSINLSKQKWDEVTAATFEHLKFLYHNISFFWWWNGDIPIIVDLPYVHKILKDRCNHTIEDCLFCQKVMKEAIDLIFSKNNSVRVIAVILDPRLKMDGVRRHYKKIYGRDADRYIEKVNKDFRDVYDAYAATDSSNSKSYKMLDATSSPKSELDLYMKELKVPAVQQFDILAWWRGNAPFYPTLARMARDYLALKSPFNGVFHERALIDLLRDIRDTNYNFKFCDLPEIITPLLCLKGFLSSAEN